LRIGDGLPVTQEQRIILIGCPHLSAIRKDQPQEIALNGLKPNTRYSYQLRDASSGEVLVAGGFHTARPPGSAYTFTVLL
jgi:hypothetical protein